MATLYTTGPAYLYIASVAGQNAQFLGTAEYAPRIEIRPGWEPVFNDLGGSKVPFDMSYQGEEGFTFAEINRYNEVVLARLQARPQTANYLGVATPPRGLNYPVDIGTLMLTEGLTVTLYVVFPFAGKAAFRSHQMPPGYRFPGTYLVGPDDLSNLGTKPRKVGLIFHHLRLFDRQTGRFLLYDNTIPQLPAID